MIITHFKSRTTRYGATIHSYLVTGTDEQLESFKKYEDKYLRINEESGNPIWSANFYYGKTAKLEVLPNGRVTLGERLS